MFIHDRLSFEDDGTFTRDPSLVESGLAYSLMLQGLVKATCSLMVAFPSRQRLVYPSSHLPTSRVRIKKPYIHT